MSQWSAAGVAAQVMLCDGVRTPGSGAALARARRRPQRRARREDPHAAQGSGGQRPPPARGRERRVRTAPGAPTTSEPSEPRLASSSRLRACAGSSTAAGDRHDPLVRPDARYRDARSRARGTGRGRPVRAREPGDAEGAGEAAVPPGPTVGEMTSLGVLDRCREDPTEQVTCAFLDCGSVEPVPVEADRRRNCTSSAARG